MSVEQKIEAARAALEEVKPGMKLGIGTGSTAEEFVRLLAQKIADGLDIIGVPTSERTAALCNELGVPLTTLEETPNLDLTIDGADEVDSNLNLIKGGGGALLREKIVAMASTDMVVIADGSKVVPLLGMFSLPIEVNSFGLAVTKIQILKTFENAGLKGELILRGTEAEPFITDGGHLILDASFGHIPDAVALSASLLEVPGVVQHGLFINIASKAFIAGPDGVTILSK